MNGKRVSLPLWASASVIYLFIYAPLAVVVAQSFNSAPRGGAWSGFTLQWYQELWQSPEKVAAVKNTLIVAGMSTSIATVLGVMLGYGLSRYSFPGKKLFSWLMYIPIVVPDIVAAVAMLMFFALARSATGFFELGLSTMIVAHITFQTPLIGIIVRARLADLDAAMEEAAHDLGANHWQTFRHVTLPLMRPAVFAGAALAFTMSIDDFVISFFTAGPGSSTLPILIYASVKRGITPDINALSTLILVGSILGTLAVTLARGRKGEF